MKRILVAILLLMLATPAWGQDFEKGLEAYDRAAVAAAQKVSEFKASAIQVQGDSATMHYHKDYLITTVSGVVGKAGIPRTIRLGDVIRVEDRVLKVNHIFATKCLKTMKYRKETLCRKGQVQCVIVERPEDRPTDEERDRLWIHVKQCVPLR